MRGSKYITTVIQLPNDPAARQKICDTLKVGGLFHGGRVTGMSAEDEMSLLQQIEAHVDFDPQILEDARAAICALSDPAPADS